MSFLRRNRALLNIVVCLTVLRQGHLLGGMGKLMTFAILAFLLLFVASRSVDICRLIVASLRAISFFLFAVIIDFEPSWRSLSRDCYFEAPLLPCHFQRPPPVLTY